MEIRQHSGPLWVPATVRLVWMSGLQELDQPQQAGPQEHNQLRQARLQEHNQPRQAGPAHAMDSRTATMRWSKPLGCIFSCFFLLRKCISMCFCCQSFSVTHFCDRVHMKTFQICHFVVCFEVIFLKLNYIFTFTMMASIEISSSLLWLVFVFIDIYYYIYFM